MHSCIAGLSLCCSKNSRRASSSACWSSATAFFASARSMYCSTWSTAKRPKIIHPVVIKTPPRFLGLIAAAVVADSTVAAMDVFGGMTRGIGGRGWRGVGAVAAVAAAVMVDRVLGRSERAPTRRKRTKRLIPFSFYAYSLSRE
eukprot:scaffold34916_cov170-Amphora_coffeaeformis.AAC.3